MSVVKARAARSFHSAFPNRQMKSALSAGRASHVRCIGPHGSFLSLGPVDPRHHLHGKRRQSSIWLDAVRAADPASVGWSKAEIQVAFTIFILLETWLV